MQPNFKAFIVMEDGEEFLGQIMYVIVWEGKALSGSEKLVAGDYIKSLEIEVNDD